MKITVAGKVKEYEDGLNVTQLIEKENVETPEYVTVSVNDEFIEKADFEKALKDGDEVAKDRRKLLNAKVLIMRPVDLAHQPQCI